jgi:Ion transport protein
VFNDGTLLEESVKKGLVSSVNMLIRAGADPFRTFEKRQPAIMVACFYGNPKIVELILDSRPEFDCSKYPEPLLHHIIRNFKKKGFYEPDTNHYKVFDLIINNANIDVNVLDKDRHSALYYAIRKNDKVSIRKLLRKHAFIGSMCMMNKTMPFDSIEPELLEQYFDTCIAAKDKNSNPGDDGYELCFNYTCFKPPTEELGAVNELTTINYIATKKKFQHLMSHPLISSFLFLKWYPLSPIFYANLLYYAIICLMLVAYVVFLYGPKVNSNAFWWMPFVFAVSIFLRELAQFVYSPKRYITSISNYLELILAALAFLVFYDSLLVSESVRRAIGALVILLAVMELIILIGSLPIFSISTHMIMLKKVTITFLRIFCLYSLILVAFACSFYKLLSESTFMHTSEFSDLPSSILKTIVMFTGEYDHSNLDFHTSLWMGNTLFVVFVFFMSIVMMNLLSGLAVSDTQVIRTKATLIDWIERAKLLTRLEQSMLNMSMVTKWIPGVFKSKEVSIRINHYANGSVIIPMIVQELADGVDDDEMPHLGWRGWFNWFLKKVLIFDYEIVKQAINVMESCVSREQEQKQRKKEENRMNGIEQTLNEVMRMLKRETKQGQGQSE